MFFTLAATTAMPSQRSWGQTGNPWVVVAVRTFWLVAVMGPPPAIVTIDPDLTVRLGTQVAPERNASYPAESAMLTVSSAPDALNALTRMRPVSQECDVSLDPGPPRNSRTGTSARR